MELNWLWNLHLNTLLHFITYEYNRYRHSSCSTTYIWRDVDPARLGLIEMVSVEKPAHRQQCSGNGLRKIEYRIHGCPVVQRQVVKNGQAELQKCFWFFPTFHKALWKFVLKFKIDNRLLELLYFKIKLVARFIFLITFSFLTQF